MMKNYLKLILIVMFSVMYGENNAQELIFKSGFKPQSSRRSLESFAISENTELVEEIFSSVGDASVRSKSGLEDTNYALDQSVYILPKSNDISEMLIKFDLSGIEGTIESVILKIHNTTWEASQGTLITLGLKAVADDSWEESTVTWNTKPDFGSVLLSKQVVDNIYNEFDITDYISQEFSGDQVASLSVFVDMAWADPFDMRSIISSGESVNPPQLVVTSNQVIVEGSTSETLLTAVDDALVRNKTGDGEDINYGSDATAFIQPKGSDTGEAFIKFDLGEGLNNITNAKLRIYTEEWEGTSGTVVNVGIREVADDTWSETTLTWNNKPSVQGGIISADVVNDAYVEFDITNYVIQEASADGIVSVNAYVSMNWADPFDQRAYLSMKESTNAPQLVVTTFNPIIATWDGSSWGDNSPSESISAKIEGNYSGAGFTCIDLTVDAGISMSIASGATLDVKGDIMNNGTILISSGASIMTYSSQSFTGNDLTIQRSTRYGDGRYSFVGSPVAQNSSNTASDLGASIYTYDEGQSATTDALSRWIPQANEAELVSGRGYTQASQQLISFVGAPNSGTITYVGSYINDGWHLVSNPYGAAILLDDFLDANLNTTGAIYIWDDNNSAAGRGTNDDYIVANKTGAVDVHATSGGGPNSEARWNGYIGSAQAFFVQLDGSAGTITFEEAMRRAGNNGDDNFFRKSEEDSEARLLVGLSDEEIAMQTLIGWNNDVSDDELTIGYDAPVFDELAVDAIYSMKSGKKLTIQTVTSQAEIIPFGYSVSKEGQYSLSFQNQSNVANEWVLSDAHLTKTHFLSDGAYTFQSQIGNFEDRFTITKASSLLASDHKGNFIYVFGKTLFIKGVDNASGIVSLYDLLGQRVFHKAYSQNTQMDLSLLPAGVYVIAEGATTSKVILK